MCSSAMYSLGIDVGTSGIRAVIMDHKHCVLAEAQIALPQSQAYYSLAHSAQQIIGYAQNPNDWWETLKKVFFQLSESLLINHQLTLDIVTHLAIDGTSGTVLLCNKQGDPVSEALMYNDQRAVEQADTIKACAPNNTAAIGTTSGLAKMLWLYKQYLLNNNHGAEDGNKVHYALNQADWLNGQLTRTQGISDHNNALKMGYDAQTHCWPDWLLQLLNDLNFPVSLLPEVFSPGDVIGKISLDMAKEFGFNPELKICAGTTDSTAAIYASGASNVGDAVTSLGSTLVMKIISETPVFDPQSGVYSQPYGDLWLVGGSSNSGGEVLKQFFSSEELSTLTEVLDNKRAQHQFSMLNLNYYPLSAPGERFPVQDPNYEARLLPRPEKDIDFFQALLEGMADIETIAYKKLVDLGAPYPKLVKSMGGGALNSSWCYIREQKLGVPVKSADLDQAAAGTALLAQATWSN